MEHLKTRLMATFVALAVAAVMITSTSYAWFTLSTNPEVSNIIAGVSANQNLEIALDDGYETALDVDVASSDEFGVQGSVAGDPYTWGNYVDLTRAFDQEEVLLQQVKFTLGSDIIIEYPLYGADGRIAGLDTCKSMAVSDYEGKGTKGGIRFYAGEPGVSENYAYSVTYWMRTNVTGDVSLSKPAKRANDGTDTTTGVNGVMGDGSHVSIPVAGNGRAAELDAFMSNLRVVFVDESGTEPSLLFEASIGPGVSDGTFRRYELATDPGDLESGAVYISELSSEPIRLTANEARKITMYVYVNGEDITNGEALLYDVTGVEINVQFDNSALDDTKPEGGAMTGDTTDSSVYTNGVTN